MRFLKTLNALPRTLAVFKHQNPSLPSTTPLHNAYTHHSNAHETASTLNSPTSISLFLRNRTTSSQLVSEHVVEELNSTHSDGEDVTRNGVVESHGNIEENGVSEVSIDSKLKEIEELKNKLYNLEKVVKRMKENSDHNIVKKKKKNGESLKLEEPPTSLHYVFTSDLSDVNVNKLSVGTRVSKVKPQPVKNDNPIMKELSPEMATLARRLHQDGYFENLRFGVKNEFDLNAFSNPFAHGLLRFAAEKFGQDHQELAKWLSGSDMKKVVLSGCPSVEKNSVFAAKRLRSFFHIQEDIVCRGCNIKSSCKFVNKKVWREKENLNLADAMRVLVSYALGSTQQMAMSHEVKASINKLLQDVINLSQ